MHDICQCDRQILKGLCGSRRHGYGIYVYEAGGRYEGEWMNDTMVGKLYDLMALDFGSLHGSGKMEVL